jgi:metacaspase-1
MFSDSISGRFFLSIIISLCSSPTVLYADHKVNTTTLTFAQVINSMRTNLSRQQFSQIPQLSSSKEMDIFHEDFYLVPPECTGTKRAVLIGINYFGQQGELTGCINDCLNMKDYIINVWGFAEENIIVLTDDDQNDARPTKSNILAAYQKVAGQATSGDAIFCHYSGTCSCQCYIWWLDYCFADSLRTS